MENKTTHFAFRMTPDEATDFERAAAVAGLSRSQAVRVALSDFADAVTTSLESDEGALVRRPVDAEAVRGPRRGGT